jgi:hypothetical protein
MWFISIYFTVVTKKKGNYNNCFEPIHCNSNVLLTQLSPHKYCTKHMWFLLVWQINANQRWYAYVLCCQIGQLDTMHNFNMHEHWLYSLIIWSFQVDSICSFYSSHECPILICVFNFTSSLPLNLYSYFCSSKFTTISLQP